MIKQTLNGDPTAYEGLVRAYEDRLYGLCYRLCRNPEDARDMTQEAFVRAWRGLYRYKQEAAFSTWLYRLAANVCIDYLRRQKRRQTVSLTAEEENAELEITDPSPTPEEHMLQKQEQNEVERAMNRLNDRHRLILALRVMENLSYEQIAEITGLKVGTVKSRLARAREQMRRYIEEEKHEV